MVEVIGVRFKNAGKIYYFEADGHKVVSGDKAIVETARGIELGEVVLANFNIDLKTVNQPLKKVLRKATNEDIKKAEINKKKEADAFKICSEKIKEHKLDMKLTDVEYAFDGSKMLFYFTADGRVDFRELVKNLAFIFKTRIELRQIGVRDESKMMGGVGVCGQQFCCSRFLSDFTPVSIKMAKEQGLSLNPSKISGSCGRLMCCLSYEQPAYEYLNSITPGVGSLVKTSEGNGIVSEVNLLKGLLKVRLDKNKDGLPKEFSLKEITVLKRVHPNKKGNAADQAADKELRALED